MFNTTHTLVGLALAHTGLNKWTRDAAWTAALASNLPDIDIVTGLYDMPAYIDHHRGFTHSIAGIPVLSIVLATALYKFSGNFWKTFVVAVLAMSTHPMLDYLNTYGLRPFLPFSGEWFYGDALFIIDPVFDGILIAALAVGHFVKKRQQHLAVIGLVLVALYTGMRLELRNLARSHLTAYEKAAVSPLILNPFQWIGLIDNPTDVTVASIDPFNGILGEPDRVTKAPTTEVVSRAAESRAGAAFHGFARFPVTKLAVFEGGYSVLFYDVRYYNAWNRTAFGATIRLDESLRVVDESLSFSEPLD